MLECKILGQRYSSANKISVYIEFDEEKRIVKACDSFNKIEYEIISHMEKHKIITIRNPSNNELISAYYGVVAI